MAKGPKQKESFSINGLRQLKPLNACDYSYSWLGLSLRNSVRSLKQAVVVKGHRCGQLTLSMMKQDQAAVFAVASKSIVIPS